MIDAFSIVSGVIKAVRQLIEENEKMRDTFAYMTNECSLVSADLSLLGNLSEPGLRKHDALVQTLQNIVQCLKEARDVLELCAAKVNSLSYVFKAGAFNKKLKKKHAKLVQLLPHLTFQVGAITAKQVVRPGGVIAFQMNDTRKLIESLLDCPSARAFWFDGFGMRLSTSSSEMFNALSQYVVKKGIGLGQIDPHDGGAALLIKIDPDKDGFVTVYEFSQFCAHNLTNALLPYASPAPPAYSSTSSDAASTVSSPSSSFSSPVKPVVVGGGAVTPIQSPTSVLSPSSVNSSLTPVSAQKISPVATPSEGKLSPNYSPSPSPPAVNNDAALAPVLQFDPSKKTVLWVDPNPQNNEKVRLLAQKNHDIVFHCVPTAEEAIELLDAEDGGGTQLMMTPAVFRIVSNNAVYDEQKNAIINVCAAERLVRFLRGQRSSVPVLIYCNYTLPAAKTFAAGYAHTAASNDVNHTTEFIQFADLAAAPLAALHFNSPQ